MYKQYVTLLLSAVATFNAKKAPKSRQTLKEDLHANIFYMEGYLQEDDMGIKMTPMLME